MGYVGKKPADIIATAVDTTTGTFSGDLTVDTNTLYVDSANNNVGINTLTPNTTNLNSGTTSGIVVKSGGVAKNNFVALPSTGGAQWDIREAGGSGGEFTMRMFDTSGTHNVQINSNGNHFFNGGNVGIGTSLPEKLLHVHSGDSTITPNSSASLVVENNGVGIINILKPNGTVGILSFSGNSVNSDGRVAYDDSGASRAMQFYTASTEQMRISNSGHVGIGVVPETSINTLRTLQIGNGGAIMSHDSSGSTNSLYASSNAYYSSGWKYINTGTATEYKGINGEHVWSNASSGSADGAITWSERMRIDSSGNLLVGTTDNELFDNTSGGGLCYRPSLSLDIAREATSSSNSMLTLNNTGVDARFIDFRKDSTTVGSIGVADSGDRIYLAGGGLEGVGIDNGANAFVPTSETGAFKDNHLSLGQSGARFENLYLSGGVYIGGTGSANYLEDYEEGTWTPSVTVGSVTASYGFYTKIGRQVFLSGRVGNFSNTVNNEVLYITGLPFVDGSNNTVIFGTSMVEGVDKDFGYEIVLIDVNDRLRFFHSTNGSSDPLRHIDLDSSSSLIYFQGTYFV